MRELMRKDHLYMVASSLAYTTILSIIPVLAVSFAVFHAFGGLENLFETVEPFILSHLAHGTGKEAVNTLKGFITNTRATAVGAGGFIGLIVTTMLMFQSAENAINHIWGAVVRRSFFQRLASYWLLVTLGPMALAIGVGMATSSGLPVTQWLPSGSGIILLGVGMLFVVYQFVPNCQVNWRYSFISASLAGLIWNLAKEGYEIYTVKFLSYNKIYGSLGAIPILLVWIYIMWLILLSGAALGATLQKRFDIAPEPIKK